MTNNQRQGNVFMIAGPSGVGKGTVVKRILELDPQIKISVSATTRSPRPNEIPGVSYHYMTQQQFDEQELFISETTKMLVGLRKTFEDKV